MLVDAVRSLAPGLIFTTALPPAVLAGALAALAVLAGTEGRALRRAHQRHAAMLRRCLRDACLPALPSQSHIVPLRVSLGLGMGGGIRGEDHGNGGLNMGKRTPGFPGDWGGAGPLNSGGAGSGPWRGGGQGTPKFPGGGMGRQDPCVPWVWGPGQRTPAFLWDCGGKVLGVPENEVGQDMGILSAQGLGVGA